jgi:HlyD family secretion protein
MEAGVRREAIAGQQARVHRILEELRELQEQQERLIVCTPVGGVVTTHRFRESVGRYYQAGDAILLVEDVSALEAEIQLDEQCARRLRNGQSVKLRARSLPLEARLGIVQGIGDAAEPGEGASHIKVVCSIEDSAISLRPGMSGYARVNTGLRPVGVILIDRVLRYLRTEYWW